MGEQKEPCNKRIKQALELRGMKQTDLVEATGIGKSAISQYLSGKYVPIERIEEVKRVVTKEEQEFLKLFNSLDAVDKENLKNYINNVLLIADKYTVKKELSNA